MLVVQLAVRALPALRWIIPAVLCSTHAVDRRLCASPKEAMRSQPRPKEHRGLTTSTIPASL